MPLGQSSKRLLDDLEPPLLPHQAEDRPGFRTNGKRKLTRRNHFPRSFAPLYTLMERYHMFILLVCFIISILFFLVVLATLYNGNASLTQV